MGVKWLLHWQPARGLSPSAVQDEALLISAIESLGAKQVKDKRWEVKCTLLRQAQTAAAQELASGGPKPSTNGRLLDSWLIQTADSPHLCYLLNRQMHQVAPCENDILPMLEKRLQYRIRSVFKFEGRRWLLGDFNIKLGQCSQSVAVGSAFLGIVMEIEYCPLSHTETAAKILEEMVELVRGHVVHAVLRGGAQQIPGSLELVKQVWQSFSLEQQFSHSHSAVQFTEAAHMLVASISASRQGTTTGAAQQAQPGLPNTPTANQQGYS